MQLDLVISHPGVGILFFTAVETLQPATNMPEEQQDVTPLALQTRISNHLHRWAPEIYQFLQENPQHKLRFRFGLYVNGERASEVRQKIPKLSTIHIVCGSDELTLAKLPEIVPLLDDKQPVVGNMEWLPRFQSPLQVFNDYWPTDVQPPGNATQRMLPQTLFVDQQRSQQIREICEERKITQLIHFTHVNNLASILKHGLRSRGYIDKLRLSVCQTSNDPQRADLQTFSSSLSISFPNYRMFFRLRQNEPANWVVLALESSLLWELDCAFCNTNAASTTVRQTPLAVRQQPAAFKRLFADSVGKVRATLPIPAWFTTDPQAEVLVFDPIIPSYIRCINFYNTESLRDWRRTHQLLAVPDLRVEKDYFQPRRDYALWTITE